MGKKTAIKIMQKAFHEDVGDKVVELRQAKIKLSSILA
jgi:hypothetical protein